jgi:hypothetical protein
MPSIRTLRPLCSLHEKDDTNKASAVKEVLKQSYQDFLLSDIIGERPDHTSENVSLMLDTQGKNVKVLDDYSKWRSFPISLPNVHTIIDIFIFQVHFPESRVKNGVYSRPSDRLPVRTL